MYWFPSDPDISFFLEQVIMIEHLNCVTKPAMYLIVHSWEWKQWFLKWTTLLKTNILNLQIQMKSNDVTHYSVKTLS